jgi:hypothetical protein
MMVEGQISREVILGDRYVSFLATQSHCSHTKMILADETLHYST